MPLKPGSFALTALLALLVSIGPLSTDMYLPSLPDMTRLFGTDVARAQLTLSVFLFGSALGQLIYGPVADRLGRKPVLLASLALFCLATLVCFAAPTIDILIAARFVQAIGAAGPMVLARAVVRDLYRAEQAGRMLAHMGALMGLVPAFAPILGGFTHEVFGWRFNFGLIAASSLFMMAAVFIALPETLDQARRRSSAGRKMRHDYGQLLASGHFVYYVLLACLSFGGLFAFISGSSFVLQNIYHLRPLYYGGSFAIMVSGYISGTLIGAHLTMRVGMDRVIVIGAALLLLGGTAMIALVHLLPGNPWSIIAPMSVYAAGIGLLLPQSVAAALTPFPEKAGTASSLQGFLQISAGAVVGIYVGHTYALGAAGLAGTIATMGLGAFGLVLARKMWTRARLAGSLRS